MVQLEIKLARPYETGLTVLAEIYYNGALVTTVSLIEQPTGSALYRGAWNAPTQAKDYTVAFISSDGTDRGSGTLFIGANGSEVTLGGSVNVSNGDVLVDHNYGGIDALRVTHDTAPYGPIDNFIIRAYLKAQYDVGAYDLEPPTTVTNSNGRWVMPLMLNPGLYYLTGYNPVTKATSKITLNVVAPA